MRKQARQEALKAEEEDRDEDEANPPASAGPSYVPPRRAASEAPASASALRPGVAFGPRASTSTSSALPPRPTPTSSALPPCPASAHARSYSTGMSTSSSAPASPPSSTFSPPFTRQTSVFQPHAPNTSATSGPPSTSTFAPTLNLAPPPSPSPLGPTFLSATPSQTTSPLSRPGRALRSRNSSRGASASASAGGSKSASGASTPGASAAGADGGAAGEEGIEHLGAGIKRRWAAAGAAAADSVVELSPPPPEEPAVGAEGSRMEVEPMADMEGWDGRGERPLKRVTRTPRHSGMGGAATPVGSEAAGGEGDAAQRRRQ